MWNLEKWTYFRDRNRETGVEKRHVDTERREWGVGGGARSRGQTESSTGRYALPYAKQRASGTCCTAQRAQLSAPRWPSRVGGSAEREGIHVYIEMIHFVVQQKLTQHCKAIILQLKKKNPVRQVVSLWSECGKPFLVGLSGGLNEIVSLKSHSATPALISVDSAVLLSFLTSFRCHTTFPTAHRRHIKKPAVLQMPKIWLPLTSTLVVSLAGSRAWVWSNSAFQPPKSIPPHFPGWALWTTHRFHSESLDEKLESLEAEDLMSQPSHQKITWIGGGDNKKGDKSHTAGLRQKTLSQTNTWFHLEASTLVRNIPTPQWPSRNGKEDSWETTVSAIHFGADISISKCAQVLWNPSCILFLALRWRAIYKSLTSPDLGSETWN